MKRAPRGLAFFWAAAALLTVLLALTLPISHAEWREVLGVGGSVSLGAWAPTPTEPGPGLAGTSLEASLTAGGFFEDGGWGVSGTICITNQGEAATVGLEVTTLVQAKAGPGGFQDLPGVFSVISPSEPLLPREGGCYDYRLGLEPMPHAKYRVVAQVTILNHSGWLPGGPHCAGPEPCPFGPDLMADFELPDLPDGRREPPLTPELGLTQAPQMPADDQNQTGTPAPAEVTPAAPPSGTPAVVLDPLPSVTPAAP